MKKNKAQKLLNEFAPHVVSYLEHPYTGESVLVFKNPVRSDLRKDNRDLRGFYIKDTQDVYLWNADVSHENAWHQLKDLGYDVSNSISFTMDRSWVLIYSSKEKDTDDLFNRIRNLFDTKEPTVEYGEKS